MQHLNGMFVRYAQPARYALLFSLYAYILSSLAKMRKDLKLSFQNHRYIEKVFANEHFVSDDYSQFEYPSWFPNVPSHAAPTEYIPSNVDDYDPMQDHLASFSKRNEP